MRELIDRILVTDFVWGFYDIRFHCKEWWRMVTQNGNDNDCLYTKQWTHDFFNGMTSAVSRYCDYYIEYEKFV